MVLIFALLVLTLILMIAYCATMAAALREAGKVIGEAGTRPGMAYLALVPLVGWVMYFYIVHAVSRELREAIGLRRPGERLKNAEWAGHLAGATFILAYIARMPVIDAGSYAPVVVLVSTLVMLSALARWIFWVNRTRARLTGAGEVLARA